MLEQLKTELLGILGIENVAFDESMKKHTSFQIGGPAKIFARPQNVEQIQMIRTLLKDEELPMYVLGNGSNVLIKDEGYPGCIIQIGTNMSDIKIEDSQITAQSGAKLSALAMAALEAELTGLEFASGIPGTVGGSMVMNAGAYDGQMSNLVKEVQVLDREGHLCVLTKEEMKFGYRTSILKNEPLIVTEATFILEKGIKEEIQSKQNEFTMRRAEKQPLTFASAGSTFKRPKGNYVGKLIMEAGLKGYIVGDAQISEKHCGFVINRGNATEKDVKALIAHVQKVVNEKYAVMLEPEVIFLDTVKK